MRALTAERIAEINGATLSDRAGVRIIRGAAKEPGLWKYVHPDVKNVLGDHVFETALQALGETLDYWLGEIEAYGLPAVKESLQVHLKDFHESRIGAEAVQAERPAIERAVIRKRRPAIEAAAVKKHRPIIEADAVEAARPTIEAEAVQKHRPAIEAESVVAWKQTTAKRGAERTAALKRERNKRDAEAITAQIVKGLTLDAAVRHYLQHTESSTTDWYAATHGERQRMIEAAKKRTRPFRKKQRTVAG